MARMAAHVAFHPKVRQRGDCELSKALIFGAVDNRDGDRMTLSLYDYDKVHLRNSAQHPHACVNPMSSNLRS
jgi:hypothetical protein